VDKGIFTKEEFLEIVRIVNNETDNKRGVSNEEIIS
jgi:hypothetical protein